GTTVLGHPYGEPNALPESHDGWAPEYFGYSRTPILFNSLANGNKRVYPEYDDTQLKNVYPEYPQALQLFAGVDPQLFVHAKLLSSDDEITRAHMPEYRPIVDMQYDFADDQYRRDKFLDLFKTLRGIAVLTLSYLDKTVAAGLATTQQQVDQEMQTSLLKVASQTLRKMSEPDRNQIHVDAEEKMEACLAGTAKMATGRFDNFNITNCIAQCGDPTGLLSSSGGSSSTSSGSSSTSGGLTGGNPYSFCLCCVDVTPEITRTLDSSAPLTAGPQPPGTSKEGVWSLVDRVLFGTDIDITALPPIGPGTGTTTGGQRVWDFATFFREMYGDVELDERGFRTVWPEYTVPEKIDAIKLGCGSTGGSSSSGACTGTSCSGGSGTLVCPITGQMVTDGIRKSLIRLLGKVPLSQNDLATNSTLMSAWVEVSTCKLIDTRDLEAMLQLRGSKAALAPGEQIEGRLLRMIETFSDACSVVAFKRLHTRIKTLVVDHLAASRKASSRDKQMLMALIKRVDDYLAFAEYDARANWAPMQMAAGIN
ncbi:MAG: hypothetical protein KDD44_10790, partial [Bdellovibrionales bacterium]|nr:hypothetical protein [Bdellovibrionales bacterium]